MTANAFEEDKQNPFDSGMNGHLAKPIEIPKLLDMLSRFLYNATEPIMLNPKIVNVLFKSAVIESFGSGFERTFKACSKAGVKYEYDNTRTGFKFVFWRSLGHKMSKT